MNQTDWKITLTLALMLVTARGFCADGAGSSLAVEAPEKPILLAPYLEIPNAHFEVGYGKDDGEDVPYSPNTALHLGLRASFKDWGFSYSHGLGTSREDNIRYGKTRYYDTSLSYYGKSFGFSAYFQKYHGFYIDDEDRKQGHVKHDGDELTVMKQRPDLKLNNMELDISYIFSPDQFSLAAANELSAIAKKSAGSPLAMVAVQRIELSGQTPLTADLNLKASSKNKDLISIRTLSLSPMGGYGYTWVYPGNYYFMMSGLIGPSFEQKRARYEEGKDKKQTGIGTKAHINLALGRNEEDYIYGMTVDAINNSSQVSDVTIDYSTVKVLFFGGIRLRDSTRSYF